MPNFPVYLPQRLIKDILIFLSCTFFQSFLHTTDYQPNTYISACLASSVTEAVKCNHGYCLSTHSTFV